MNNHSKAMWNSLKETTNEIKKLKIDLGSINPKDVPKKKLKSNVNNVKQKMLQAIHSLENKIETQIKDKVEKTIKNESTIQNGPIKKEMSRLVFVNTYDKLTKKRANDLLQLKPNNSQLEKTKTSNQSYLWGRPAKVESKRLEDKIPGHIKLSKPENCLTKDFLIKNLTKENEFGGGIYGGNSVTQYFMKPKFDFKKHGINFHERSKSGFYKKANDSSGFQHNRNYSIDNNSFTLKKPDLRVNHDSFLDVSTQLKGNKGKVCHSKTTKPKKILPREVRENPFCNLPVLMDEDQNLGLINLVNQGLIPKDVDVSPALDRDDPVLRTKKIHSYNLRNMEANLQENMLLDQAIQIINAKGYNLHNDSHVNTELSIEEQQRTKKRLEEASIYSHINKTGLAMNSGTYDKAKPMRSTNKLDSKSPYNLKNYQHMVDDQKQNPDNSQFITQSKINTKELIQSMNKTHLKVEGGKIQENEKYYIEFKTKNFHIWGDIKIILMEIEKLLQKHAILSTKLDKEKIIHIASRMKIPSEKELFDCLENKDMVLELIPNRTEKLGDRIEKHLITRLQGFMRLWLGKKYYKKVKQFKSNFIFIQNWMRICFNYKILKRKIFMIYKSYQMEFDQRQEEFKREWSMIKDQKRLEIHINSLGFDKFKRKTTNNFVNKQNLQLSRIFRLRDPNLEQVIITSTETPIELMAYYVKILEVSGIQDPASRIHFLFPENAEKFETAELCLSANIYYSPEVMKKIRFLAEGKNAYIVNGYPSNYDLILAVKLGQPSLTGDPNLSRTYSMQSTSKLLFDDINLPTMPHTEVLVDEEDMVRSFANLILQNPNFDKWVFKVNDEFYGRGIASYSTEGLEIINKIRIDNSLAKSDESQKEVENYIRKFLPTHQQPASQSIFRNYQDYRETFLNTGGIIEGCPKSTFKSVGLVFYIDPEGIFDIITHYEKIIMEKLTIGYILPQKQIPLKVLVQTTKKVASYLYENNIYGYITIDFMVLQSNNSTIKISPCGLKCYYDDFIAIYELFSLFNNLNETKNDDETSAVIFPIIDNLGFSSKLDYETFFDNCRKQSIYYDVNRNSGTMFIPFDNLAKGVMGLMVIDSNLKQILKYANKTLTYIGNLMTQDELASDEDQKKHFITVNMVSDRLYNYQKQFT